MASPTNKLAVWFAVKWDGSATDYIRDLGADALELYHPAVELATSDGGYGLDEITKMNQFNVKRGLRCNIIKLEALDYSHVEYMVELHYQDNDERMTLHSLGTFLEGKLIRVERFDSLENQKMKTPS